MCSPTHANQLHLLIVSMWSIYKGAAFESICRRTCREHVISVSFGGCKLNTCFCARINIFPCYYLYIYAQAQAHTLFTMIIYHFCSIAFAQKCPISVRHTYTGRDSISAPYQQCNAIRTQFIYEIQMDERCRFQQGNQYSCWLPSDSVNRASLR